jgi:hypothetical protein
MARLLDGLRRKIHQAVHAAALDMQAVMDYQMEYAMLYHPWEWRGMIDEEERRGYPYSNSGGNGANGALMQSKDMSQVIKLKTATGTTYAFSWQWDPLHESGRSYAALVHNGSATPIEYQMYYPEENPGPFERYSARPWTAWITPYDQRGRMSVRSELVQPIDVPDVGWQFARSAFVDALRTRLNGVQVKVSL